MRANPFRGPLEGVGPENRDFFGPKKVVQIWVNRIFTSFSSKLSFIAIETFFILFFLADGVPPLFSNNSFSHDVTVLSLCWIKLKKIVIFLSCLSAPPPPPPIFSFPDLFISWLWLSSCPGGISFISLISPACLSNVTNSPPHSLCSEELTF